MIALIGLADAALGEGSGGQKLTKLSAKEIKTVSDSLLPIIHPLTSEMCSYSAWIIRLEMF